ncbi:hypothetical protein QWY77_09005 [Thalassotalea ponticola]|uniref:hypothetical protein n=1 Tax=Thalassotalea ponticola TaxID=1523392 RepID=UPI0025B37D7E|nr:hypothetical protein [Thalassotalea ponticola]MDN3652901.1 hypothetical protein [Thalassotalea ponticola]
MSILNVLNFAKPFDLFFRSFVVSCLCCLLLTPAIRAEQQESTTTAQAPATDAQNEQHDEPVFMPLTDVFVIEINEVNRVEFESALKEHLQYRLKKGEKNTWHIYTPVVGDKLNVYMMSSCCTNWDQLSDHKAWAKQAGTVEHWREKVLPFIVNTSHYYSRYDKQNSAWDSAKPVQYFAVETLKIAPGKGIQAREMIKQVSDAAKQIQWPLSWLWNYRVGGEAQVELVVGYESYADMMPPELSFYQALTEHLGTRDEAKALLERYGSSFSSSSYTIYVHRQSLSSPNSTPRY